MNLPFAPEASHSHGYKTVGWKYPKTAQLNIEGEATIIGAGNGDPAFKGEEQPDALVCKTFCMPAFNGRVQFIIKKLGGDPVCHFMLDVPLH